MATAEMANRALKLAALPELEERWQTALHGQLNQVENQGLLACVFVLRGAMRLADRRWRQGPRVPPLENQLADLATEILAQRHVYRVEAQVAIGLLAWANGQRRLHARLEVPDPLELLEFQGRGERIVSLLPEGVPTGHEPNNFEFALHDLCHAEKFFAPQHFHGQVGLFHLLHSAQRHPAWLELTHPFDAAWQAEFHHVAADMNGSPLFLFSALRRKVMNAALRLGKIPQEARRLLCHALEMPEEVMMSAEKFTVHPDVPPEEVRHHAGILEGFFAEVGRARLQGLTPRRPQDRLSADRQPLKRPSMRLKPVETG